MMTLKELFDMQAALNERVGLDDKRFAEMFAPGCPDYTEHQEALFQAGRWIDDMLKAMSSEIEELRNCTYWKHWCSEAQAGERYKIKDVEAARKEVIDILHFWISLAQILGMSPEMVSDMYRAKLAQNIKRQDDGYSIKIKDLAWELFLKEPHRYGVTAHAYRTKEPTSLEDLPESVQEFYLGWAKIEIENESTPICSNCGRRCDIGYAMTGEGPLCVRCV